MKIAASFITLFLPISSYCQIPNSDFENWAIINGIEEPVYWETNNEINSISVTKTNESYEGNFALQVINNGPSFEGPLPGYASVVFAPVNIPAQISAYVKCDRISGTGKGIISVLGFSEGMDNIIGKWETTVEIPQFTLIKIPLNPVKQYDSLAIIIEAFAGMDTLGWPTGNSSIKVDCLSDETNTVINELSFNSSLTVFPNPCRKELNIRNSGGTIYQCVIFNVSGKLLFKKNFGISDIRLNLKDYRQGIYFIRTIDNKGIITTNKIIMK
jgi:hypothetical protein